jgi:hypothetical protein
VVLAVAVSWSLGVAIAVGRGEEEEMKWARVSRGPGDGELVLFQLRSFLAVGLHPTVQVVLARC